MVLTNNKKSGSAGAELRAGTAPTSTQPNQKAHKLTTQGRKPRHRSTKAELDRERMTAKVIVCLVSGKTIEETAKELDVSFSWVERIRRELPGDFIEYFSEAKRKEIGALIEEGLRAQILAMNQIVEVTKDEAWVKSHRATELATFFGVISDKVFRTLMAIERANELERVEQLLRPKTGEVS